MNKLLCLLIFALAILLNSRTVLAGGNPQITSASAAFVDSGASIRVQWQADEPITRVMISIGSERKTIDVDIRDNSRTPSGIGGEATAVVPVMQGGVTATIQIEDEYRRKSEVVTVTITGQQRQMQPFGSPQGGFQHGMPTHDDSWGRENLARKPQLPELKVGQGQSGITGTPGMPVLPQDQGMAVQQQPQGMMPQMQGGGMMPPPAPMQQPAMNIPPPLPNQGVVPQPPTPVPQNIPGMVPPPPPQMPMDPGMLPPPPPPPPM